MALNLIVLPPQVKHFCVLNSYKISSRSHYALRQCNLTIKETDTFFASCTKQQDLVAGHDFT